MYGGFLLVNQQPCMHAYFILQSNKIHTMVCMALKSLVILIEISTLQVKIVKTFEKSKLKFSSTHFNIVQNRKLVICTHSTINFLDSDFGWYIARAGTNRVRVLFQKFRTNITKSSQISLNLSFLRLDKQTFSQMWVQIMGCYNCNNS